MPCGSAGTETAAFKAIRHNYAMNEEYDSENPSITDALNAHGIFFKKRVRQALETMNLRQTTGPFGLEPLLVDEEYPVTYLEGASVDLLVRFKAGYRSHYVVTIECKRGYTARKKWIFFKERDQRSSKLIYEFKGQFQPDVYDALPLVADRVPLCIEGVEIDLSKITKRDVYRAANQDPIWKAGFQVCKGAIGYVLQEYDERRLHGLPSDEKDSSLRILPLLVTNAPLMIADLDVEKVDIASGNYAGELPVKEYPYLILRYPFTPRDDHFRDALGLSSPAGYRRPEHRSYDNKEGLAIVNVSHLQAFFQMLVYLP
jgi:hypothetical protein